VSDEVVAIETRPGGCEFKDIYHLVAGAKGREALETGDASKGLVWAGQVVGLIDDLPTCAQLVQSMVAECRERLDVARGFYRAA
jgi:nitronate monooxygenase